MVIVYCDYTSFYIYIFILRVNLLLVFLRVRCIPHQNSQRLFWASVCVWTIWKDVKLLLPILPGHSSCFFWHGKRVKLPWFLVALSHFISSRGPLGNIAVSGQGRRCNVPVKTYLQFSDFFVNGNRLSQEPACRFQTIFKPNLMSGRERFASSKDVEIQTSRFFSDLVFILFLSGLMECFCT